MVPVLLQIEIRGTHQYFQLNTSDLTSYPSEQEVLLQEGNKYKIIGLEEMDYKTLINEEEVDIKVKVVKLIAIGDKYSRVNCCKRAFYYLAK